MLKRVWDFRFLGVVDVENSMAYLREERGLEDEQETSFRILRHCASSVRHRKHHGLDIVTVQVEGSR